MGLDLPTRLREGGTALRFFPFLVPVLSRRRGPDFDIREEALHPHIFPSLFLLVVDVVHIHVAFLHVAILPCYLITHPEKLCSSQTTCGTQRWPSFAHYVHRLPHFHGRKGRNNANTVASTTPHACQLKPASTEAALHRSLLQQETDRVYTTPAYSKSNVPGVHSAAHFRYTHLLSNTSPKNCVFPHKCFGRFDDSSTQYSFLTPAYGAFFTSKSLLFSAQLRHSPGLRANDLLVRPRKRRFADERVLRVPRLHQQLWKQQQPQNFARFCALHCILRVCNVLVPLWPVGVIGYLSRCSTGTIAGLDVYSLGKQVGNMQKMMPKHVVTHLWLKSACGTAQK